MPEDRLVETSCLMRCPGQRNQREYVSNVFVSYLHPSCQVSSARSLVSSQDGHRLFERPIQSFVDQYGQKLKALVFAYLESLGRTLEDFDRNLWNRRQSDPLILVDYDIPGFPTMENVRAVNPRETTSEFPRAWTTTRFPIPLDKYAFLMLGVSPGHNSREEKEIIFMVLNLIPHWAPGMEIVSVR